MTEDTPRLKRTSNGNHGLHPLVRVTKLLPLDLISQHCCSSVLPTCDFGRGAHPNHSKKDPSKLPLRWGRRGLESKATCPESHGCLTRSSWSQLFMPLGKIHHFSTAPPFLNCRLPPGAFRLTLWVLKIRSLSHEEIKNLFCFLLFKWLTLKYKGRPDVRKRTWALDSKSITALHRQWFKLPEPQFSNP